MELRILQVENILSVDSLDGYDYVIIKELSNKRYRVLKKCEAQSRTYMTLLERDREKIEEGILLTKKF